jgi:ParB family transcriptional regulator, chromosome partitioning protein
LLECGEQMPPSRSDVRRKLAGAFAQEDETESKRSSELFGGVAPGGQLRRIPIQDVSPRADQPRQSMDPVALKELTASILKHGVLQPIRVRASDGTRYEIIAGERRWVAARQAGLREIPAVIAEADDDRAYIEALIENIQREDLNAVDRAQALKRLRVTLGLQSWEEVGKYIGISRIHVHRLLNITRLPTSMQNDIRAGDLTEKHARALLLLQGHPAQQMALWERIHAQGLSGDAAAKVAKQLVPGSASSSPARARKSRVALAEDLAGGTNKTQHLTTPSGDSSTVQRAVDGLLGILDRAGQHELHAAREHLERLRLRIAAALS